MTDLAHRFARDGFVVVEDAFDTQSLRQIRSAAEEIVERFDIDRQRTVFRTDDQDSGRDEYFFESAEKASCFLEAGALDAEGRLHKPKHLAINKIGHGLHDVDVRVAEFCRHSAIREALSALEWRDPVLQQTMYIFKQPGIGGEVRWHQDGSYLIADGRGVMGLWVALEDATKSNGCLWMQPGAHQTPLRERYTVDWSSGEASLETLDDTPWESTDAVALEVPAGALVMFSDHMPHYSATNLSDRSRHAFTMHIKESDDRWADVNWLQRKGAEFRIYG
ncbi:MAG: phytanoyl-CoA dioxygenase family protein [Pseudomonadota bacterium]